DWRQGKPTLLSDYIEPRLRAWIASCADHKERERRAQRDCLAYGLDGFSWNEEMVLQRYELLYEADLVPEAERDHTLYEHGLNHDLEEELWLENHAQHRLGRLMRFDHRRILATGIARLRAKIKYRPVVFELMPDAFTLLQLQTAIEALLGGVLIKQTFPALFENKILERKLGNLL